MKITRAAISVNFIFAILTAALPATKSKSFYQICKLSGLYSLHCLWSVGVDKRDMFSHNTVVEDLKKLKNNNYFDFIIVIVLHIPIKDINSVKYMLEREKMKKSFTALKIFFVFNIVL